MAGVATGLSRLFKTGGLEVKLLFELKYGVISTMLNFNKIQVGIPLWDIKKIIWIKTLF